MQVIWHASGVCWWKSGGARRKEHIQCVCECVRADWLLENICISKANQFSKYFCFHFIKGMKHIWSHSSVSTFLFTAVTWCSRITNILTPVRDKLNLNDDAEHSIYAPSYLFRWIDAMNCIVQSALRAKSSLSLYVANCLKSVHRSQSGSASIKVWVCVFVCVKGIH